MALQWTGQYVVAAMQTRRLVYCQAPGHQGLGQKFEAAFAGAYDAEVVVFKYNRGSFENQANVFIAKPEPLEQLLPRFNVRPNSELFFCHYWAVTNKVKTPLFIRLRFRSRKSNLTYNYIVEYAAPGENIQAITPFATGDTLTFDVLGDNAARVKKILAHKYHGGRCNGNPQANDFVKVYSGVAPPVFGMHPSAGGGRMTTAFDFNEKGELMLMYDQRFMTLQK